MKKSVFILVLLLSATQMFAQISIPKQKRGTATMMETPVFTEKSSKTAVILDTLSDHVDRCSFQNGFSLYGNVAGGFLSGTGPTFSIPNVATDCNFTEQAQTFFSSGTNQVTDVYVWFAHNPANHGVGVDDDFEIRIYNGRGASPTMLGSVGFNYGNLQPANNGAALFNNRFQFNPPVMVTDSFMVSVEVKNQGSDDTLAIVTTNPDSSCGNNEYRFWQKVVCPSAAIEAWDAAENNWQGGFDADLVVLAVVDIDQTTGRGTKSGDVRVYGCYPNPACTSTKILFELDRASPAGIRIMSLDGRIVKSEKFEANAGLNEYVIDVNDLATGTYIYTVQTARGQISSKFSVSK